MVRLKKARRSMLALTLLAFSAGGAVAAEEISSFLRLNPTMHTAMLNRIDLDQSAVTLATASDDKTVRLWDLTNGQLFRTLHSPTPMMDGNEGKLFAVALSPDGQMLAAGGWTKSGYRSFGNHTIYLIDTSNGKIVNRISGLENTILHLAFSPDGKSLAATLSGQNGLRVWRIEGLSMFLRDTEYVGDSYWVAFSPDGTQLVSSSYDGYLRLYQNDPKGKIKLQKKIKIDNQPMPFTVQFSPDGGKLAVGFVKSSRIAVLAAKDLELLYWTEPSKEGSGDLLTVAWSQDGKFLYGGGGYKTAKGFCILRWPDAGKKAPEIWPVALNTIIALRALADNRILYAAASPEWGVLDREGKTVFIHRPESTSFNRISPQGLLVSADGLELQFEHTTPEHQVMLRFSLSQRQLFEFRPEEPEAVLPTLVEPLPVPTVVVPTTLAIKDAQNILQEKGYYAGALNGLMGKEMRSAIKKFQQDHKLISSSKLDPPTVAALLFKEKPKIEEPLPEKPVVVKLNPPLLTAPGRVLKSWKNSAHPKLNGKELSLSSSDTAMSYALNPAAETLVLGTRFRLYHYDKNGQPHWQRDTPGVVWAVNVAANGKLFLAAFSDGTLRWFNLEDGAELLAFYPHADGRRWVVWTPAGMYAASVGADTLLGWNVSNSLNKLPDFFPINSLRDSYYQPQALLQALTTKRPVEQTAVDGNVIASGSGAIIKDEMTEEDPLPVAPKFFPPRVLLVSPKDLSTFNTPEVEIEYQLQLYGEAVPTDLQIILDGRPFLTLKPSEQAHPAQGRVRVTLPPRQTEISLIAKNAWGVSPPERLLQVWNGKKATPDKPNLYLLAIGIGEYANEGVTDLPFAREDAAAFTAKWERFRGDYQEIKTKILADGSDAQIIEGLGWLREAKADDLAVVFLAGHAVRHKEAPKSIYQFVAANATLANNTISLAAFKEAFDGIKSKVLLLVDTGHFSMLKGDATKFDGADIDAFANELRTPENGVIVFSATVGAQQQSQIDPDSGRGAFTLALLEALDGKGDQNGDGQLLLQELGVYVSTRVGELTKGKQTPVLAMPELIPSVSLGNFKDK